jgi:hypothetical protein
MGDYASFQSLLRDLVAWDTATSGSQDGRISANEPTIAFALAIFRCYSTCDYAYLTKVLANPYGYDKFAWVLVRSNLDKFQSKIWDTLRSAYMAVEDRTWLVKTLCLPSDPGSLKSFLEKHDAQNKIDDTTGRVLLKQSR